jgi:hypothetical protein
MAKRFGFKDSKAYAVAREMPPLKHSVPGKEFNIMESEVAAWLIQQPEIRDYIWDRIRESKAIIFDSVSGTWCGVDHGQVGAVN